MYALIVSDHAKAFGWAKGLLVCPQRIMHVHGECSAEFYCNRELGYTTALRLSCVKLLCWFLGALILMNVVRLGRICRVTIMPKDIQLARRIRGERA